MLLPLSSSFSYFASIFLDLSLPERSLDCKGIEKGGEWEEVYGEGRRGWKRVENEKKEKHAGEKVRIIPI
jgi:hypothetical protein